MKEWKDSKRHDLNKIPMMMEQGFEPDFKHTDVWAKRTTPDNVPHNPVSFKRDNQNMWYYIENTTGDIYWQTAYLLSSYFKGHKSFKNIEDAVKRFDDDAKDIMWLKNELVNYASIKKSQTLSQAIINVVDGLSSKTDDNVQLTYDKEKKMYDIDDGFHRVAEHVINRDTYVKCDIRILNEKQ